MSLSRITTVPPLSGKYEASSMLWGQSNPLYAPPLSSGGHLNFGPISGVGQPNASLGGTFLSQPTNTVIGTAPLSGQPTLATFFYQLPHIQYSQVQQPHLQQLNLQYPYV